LNVPQLAASDTASFATAPPAAEQRVSLAAEPSDADELSGDAKATYARGFQTWASGDLLGARAAFMEAAGKAPRASGPQYSLGCVLERLGDLHGALDAYRAAFLANPKYEVAIGAYAVLQARMGHGLDAEQFLNGKQAGASPRLTTFLAEVKSIEGDSPGCQELAQQALAKDPDSKDAMIVIARDYYRNRRWDLARYALQAILEGAEDGSIPPRDKGSPEALLLRGLIEREAGQRQQAIGDFEQAVAKRPDLFEAYIDLGEMKLEAGNASEAQAPLEKAVRYAPNVAVARLDLGDCYRLLGRPSDAKSQFDKAVNMDSTLAGVHYDLGLLYLFSSNVPGVAGQDDQLTKAIKELEAYKSMRAAKTAKGPGDDVDELLSTARRKQSELQMKRQAAAASAAAPAPAAPSPPPSAPVSAPAPAPPRPAAAPTRPAPAAAPLPPIAPTAAPPPADNTHIVRDLPP
jgi:tetratricopeptide (TPR) repeat protein